MAELNLNFIQETGRRELTKSEIAQIQGLALSIEAIIKALAAYSNENDGNDASKGFGNECYYVCRALELLIDPIIGYMSDYAGESASKEAEKNTQGEKL